MKRPRKEDYIQIVGIEPKFGGGIEEYSRQQDRYIDQVLEEKENYKQAFINLPKNGQ